MTAILSLLGTETSLILKLLSAFQSVLNPLVKWHSDTPFNFHQFMKSPEILKNKFDHMLLLYSVPLFLNKTTFVPLFLNKTTYVPLFPLCNVDSWPASSKILLLKHTKRYPYTYTIHTLHTVHTIHFTRCRKFGVSICAICCGHISNTTLFWLLVLFFSLTCSLIHHLHLVAHVVAPGP